MELEESIQWCEYLIRELEDKRKYELPPHKFIINSKNVDYIATILKELKKDKKNKTIEIDTGNTRGIIRKLDNLGRIVFPKEFRDELNLKYNDEMEIYLLENGFYIAKK